MPKVKIGAKVTAGEAKKDERKIFNNGHKVFTGQEAKRLYETQTTEKRSVVNFEANKASLIKPRNPISGDETPRMVYDSKGQGTQTGTLLFNPERLQTMRDSAALAQYQPPEVNTLKRSDINNDRISSLQNMQDVVGGELAYIKLKLKEKQELAKAHAALPVIRF